MPQSGGANLLPPQDIDVVLQIVYPQGSMGPALQYGMLLAFVLVLGCSAAVLVLVQLQKSLG